MNDQARRVKDLIGEYRVIHNQYWLHSSDPYLTEEEKATVVAYEDAGHEMQKLQRLAHPRLNAKRTALFFAALPSDLRATHKREAVLMPARAAHKELWEAIDILASPKRHWPAEARSIGLQVLALEARQRFGEFPYEGELKILEAKLEGSRRANGRITKAWGLVGDQIANDEDTDKGIAKAFWAERTELARAFDAVKGQVARRKEARMSELRIAIAEALSGVMAWQEAPDGS